MNTLAWQANKSGFYLKGNRASLRVSHEEVAQSVFVFHSNLLAAER